MKQKISGGSMENSHTPGPWAIYVNAPSDIVIRKMSKDGYGLCSIARVSSGYANARLIAAAPELLEALTDCVEHMHWTQPLGEAALKKAKAAIAKATGSEA